MRLNSAKDLDVYKKAYALAMEIFEISKTFPPEERYALTSQIRRSSRSVCMNLREAWAKREFILDLEHLDKLEQSSLALYPGDTIFIDHTAWLTVRDVFSVVTTAAVITSAVAQILWASKR
ncbi:MAG: four helix bundle protein [Ignavibacteria bacterium]|nr:four helix bundle protein [Ignavibacteria bacterium]